MGILVFISYATSDAPRFQISKIAETLTNYNEIEDVLYWQEDMHDNIIKFMNDNLGKCDVFLLFCSPNALRSSPVEKEWTAADALNKPIIPVFSNKNYIPPLLSSRLGIEIFDVFDIPGNVEKLYDLILKKYVPKESSTIPIMFKYKNNSETVMGKKKGAFIEPLIKFCMNEGISVKNVSLTTPNEESVLNDDIDESVSLVCSKYGSEFEVAIERMQIIANFKICMVGDRKMGKTQLLQYCVEGNFDEEYKST
ncbi:MAG: TIR domain-containing protein, partial [Candidatus Lokiarchaeota archaeon]|nr:TIR domain-containing protein [Candidatus Lokiarchaeota archaeon]